MTPTSSSVANVLPLVMFDTNVLFDFFLGRDPEVLLLAQLSRRHVEIRVPEFVLMEFRGSILRELGRKEQALSSVRQLAAELERADHWMSGVDSLRAGASSLRRTLSASEADSTRSLTWFASSSTLSRTLSTYITRVIFDTFRGSPPMNRSAGFKTVGFLRLLSQSPEQTPLATVPHASFSRKTPTSSRRLA
ncbi:hypothetical protein [Sorangium sp. So ce1099]|uniref:hypothetical protein n=1 Tax=Sorangium sp. So ce1099 TaxID=3133331 RepID=UPI003F5EF908